MKKIRYSPDIDALLIQVSDQPIFYAEDDGQMILHYSENDELVLIEILNVQSFVKSNEAARIIAS